MKDRISRLREKSGNVISTDPFVSFMYQLMRDHLAPGTVEKIVQDVISEGEVEVRYTNGYLAKYAEDLVEELRDPEAHSLANALQAAFSDKLPQHQAKEELDGYHPWMTDNDFSQLENKLSEAPKPVASVSIQVDGYGNVVDEDDDGYGESTKVVIEGDAAAAQKIIDQLEANGILDGDTIKQLNEDLQDVKTELLEEEDGRSTESED